MTTSASGMTTTSGSANNSIVIGVTVGVIIAILLATLIVVCAIIMYRRKKHSVSYPVTGPSSGYYYNVAVMVGHHSVCM